MKKGVKIILIILAVIVLLLGGGAFAANLYIDSMLNKMEREEVIKSEDAEIAEEVMETVKEYNIVNIALFGVDNDGSAADQSDMDRSDAIKVISLDMDEKTIKITSLERDLVVWLPGEINGYDHLNHAFWRGGADLAVKTINYNFDLDITQYVAFSFSALEKVVDLVGGVDVSLSGSEASILGVGGAGTYHLSGRQALSYCRIRKIDSDYSRMKRQNNVIQAIINQVKTKSVTDLMDLVSQMLPNVRTNLTNDEIKSYITSLLSFDLSEIQQFQMPSGGYDDTAYSAIGGYLVRSYTAMVKECHDNIYVGSDYQPSQTVVENEKRTYEKFGYPFE